MKKGIISGFAIMFLIMTGLFAALLLTGCFNQAQQTLPTVATAIESTTFETTVPAIPATSETAAEEKIPANFSPSDFNFSASSTISDMKLSSKVWKKRRS